ncbi:hypothetical protein ACFXGT_39055 [Streptomyces sp. NPDC059352]|uniref:hypothetical protein n=1 Tax=Streptomyces sp. NPDC059352 TaxID=3346810 RepID=UPI0036AEBA7B
MAQHELPLESALHALGRSPQAEPAAVHDLITITADQLLPGDRVLGVTTGGSPAPVLTVRRPSSDQHPEPGVATSLPSAQALPRPARPSSAAGLRR